MGRPRVPEESKRSVVVILRITVAEHIEFQAAATRDGRPIARTIREAALRAIRADAALAARCCP